MRAALALPTPTELLRRARLRYIGTRHRCQDTVSWALLHQDDAWGALVRDDLMWLWRQRRRSSSLTDPSIGLASWRYQYLWNFHPTYWKGLIKRAILHAGLQRKNSLLVSRAHLDILDELTTAGAICPGPLPVDQTALPTSDLTFGCMLCGKAFTSRGGEGAHMFRCHQKISHLRWLFDTTSCPCCLKEYYSFGRLLNHLRHSELCSVNLCITSRWYWFCGDCGP